MNMKFGKDMKAVLAQIERINLDLANLNYDLQLHRERQAFLEANLTFAILDAKHPDTGKTLYSNETAREAALKLRLHEHEEWQTLRGAIFGAERDRAKLLAQLEQLRSLFKLELLERQDAIATAMANSLAVLS
jgi:hypothetical protein